MNNTALGAENKKEQTINFISKAHEKFYYEKLKEVRYQDVYHKALCYCLGIFATIKRLAKKYKLDFVGKVYLETVRCYFTISEEELKKCRYNYKGKDTYAFVLSDKYIMALYTHCLLARKAVAFENIELNGLSEVELSMVKLENVREVLFQALLLDDVKFEDRKMYAELYTILLNK